METLKNIGFINIVIIVGVLLGIIGYCIWNLTKNSKIYDNLQKMLSNLHLDYKSCEIYLDSIKKHSDYKEKEGTLSDLNIQTLIEEIVSELKIGKEYVLNHNKNIKNTSSNCILLGVLGTFIGLTFVLFSMKGFTQSSVNDVMGGMSTAFITSICGVISSIAVGYFLNKKNTEHLLLQIMLKLENRLTSEITSEKNQILDEKVNELKSSINGINHSIKSIERFDDITSKLNKFNNGFITTINELDELMKNSKSSISKFEKNLNKLEYQFNALNGKFNKLFEIYNKNEEINKFVIDSMDDIKNNIKLSTDNQLLANKQIDEMVNVFKYYEKNTGDMVKELYSKEDKLFESILSLDKNILNQTSNLDEQKEALSQLSESVKAQMVLMKEQTEALDTNLGQSLERSLKQFERYVQTTNRVIENKLNILFKYVAMQEDIAFSSEV